MGTGALIKYNIGNKTFVFYVHYDGYIKGGIGETIISYVKYLLKNNEIIENIKNLLSNTDFIKVRDISNLEDAKKVKSIPKYRKWGKYEYSADINKYPSFKKKYLSACSYYYYTVDLNLLTFKIEDGFHKDINMNFTDMKDIGNVYDILNHIENSLCEKSDNNSDNNSNDDTDNDSNDDSDDDSDDNSNDDSDNDSNDDSDHDSNYNSADDDYDMLVSSIRKNFKLPEKLSLRAQMKECGIPYNYNEDESNYKDIEKMQILIERSSKIIERYRYKYNIPDAILMMKQGVPIDEISFELMQKWLIMNNLLENHKKYDEVILQLKRKIVERSATELIIMIKTGKKVIWKT